MKSFFQFKRSPREKPFLAPLAAGPSLPRLVREKLERLPPAALPVAVTLAGGIVLVLALGALLGGGADRPPEQAAALAGQQVAADDGEEEPAAGVAEITTSATDWASDAAVSVEDALAAADAVERPDESAIMEPVFPAWEDDAAPAADPSSRTASILPALPDLGALAPPLNIAVAETDEEVAALEAIQRQEVEADLATSSIAADATAPMRAAVTTEHVNLRAGPDDNAQVLTVVPAQAEIEAEEDCNWCAVVYDGSSGFIYRSFIRYAD